MAKPAHGSAENADSVTRLPCWNQGFGHSCCGTGLYSVKAIEGGARSFPPFRWQPPKAIWDGFGRSVPMSSGNEDGRSLVHVYKVYSQL